MKIPPRSFFIALMILCIAALVGAVIVEYVFGLKPCSLCLFQRYAYGVTFGCALLGALIIQDRFHPRLALATGLTFLGNAGIALYQVLVEKKLVDLPSTCKAPVLEKGALTFEQFKESLAKAGDHVPCDVVSFDLFGLSMAAYNALFTFTCALLCFAYCDHFFRTLKS